MKPGERWSSRQTMRQPPHPGKWGIAALLLVSALAGGCVHQAQERAYVERHLLGDRESAKRNWSVAEHYQVGCPDVLAIELASAPGVTIRQAVGADGRIELNPTVRPRVEGRTPEEIEDMLAADLGVSPESIDVRVAAYRSRQLFLFGEVVGWQRSVPYIGQETVLDLLRRVGGITPGAKPSEVYVVRPHIDEGGRPEIFHIDLDNIVAKHKQATNLRLLPNDQIYVGATRQARVEEALPPWMRPFYQAIWNTRPANSESVHGPSQPDFFSPP